MKRLFILCYMAMAAIGIACAQAPSINSIVKAVQSSSASNPKPVTDMLDNAGYTYRFSTDVQDFFNGACTRYVFSKNCKVVHEEYGNGLEYSPAKETASSSIVAVLAQGDRILNIDIQIYSKATFRKWVSQLKALGYKLSPDSGRGNRGQSWEYRASGKPDITIWNDYDTTYVLSVSM